MKLDDGSPLCNRVRFHLVIIAKKNWKKPKLDWRLHTSVIQTTLDEGEERYTEITAQYVPLFWGHGSVHYLYSRNKEQKTFSCPHCLQRGFDALLVLTVYPAVENTLTPGTEDLLAEMQTRGNFVTGLDYFQQQKNTTTENGPVSAAIETPTMLIIALTWSELFWSGGFNATGSWVCTELVFSLQSGVAIGESACSICF